MQIDEQESFELCAVYDLKSGRLGKMGFVANTLLLYPSKIVILIDAVGPVHHRK